MLEERQYKNVTSDDYTRVLCIISVEARIKVPNLTLLVIFTTHTHSLNENKLAAFHTPLTRESSSLALKYTLQAPSPEPNPNSPSPVTTMGVHYTTIES
jgi:hypothetical protein